MALLLTRTGLLRRIHHTIETSKTMRTAAISATATAVGLAAGRSRKVRKAPPLALAGAGVALSFMGITGMGDGLAAAGATVLGYRYGSTGRFTKPKPAPVAVVPGAPAAGPRRMRRRG